MHLLLTRRLTGAFPFSGETSKEILANNRKGLIEYPEDRWKNISTHARWLVGDMTNPKAEDRLTAAEALEQPWFASCLVASDTHSSVPPIVFAPHVRPEEGKDETRQNEPGDDPTSKKVQDQPSCSALAQGPMSFSGPSLLASPASSPLPSLLPSSLASPTDSKAKSPRFYFEQPEIIPLEQLPPPVTFPQVNT
jgi:serine/threonine protein kinase